jgi:hypothetical protein
MRPVSRVLIVLAAVILLILLSACGTKTAPLAPDAPNVVQTVADIELPTHLQHLSEQTRLSYQLAVVYSEELTRFHATVDAAPSIAMSGIASCVS